MAARFMTGHSGARFWPTASTLRRFCAVFDNQAFQKLVEANQLTGEVVASNSFIIEVKGLEGVRLGSQVLFEDGQHGLVREAYGDRVILFNTDSEKMEPGTLAVVQEDLLTVPVGNELIG